jgi:hypothetical protein
MDEMSKRIDMILASLIGERVDVKLETIDHTASVISVAVAPTGYSTREGFKGVSVALRQHELIKLRDALDLHHQPIGASMSKKPILVIRMNADTDSVTVDNVVYDRSQMNRDEKRMMRRIIVDGCSPGATDEDRRHSDNSHRGG